MKSLSKEEINKVLTLLKPLNNVNYYLNEKKFFSKFSVDGKGKFKFSEDDLLLYQTIRLKSIVDKYYDCLFQAKEIFNVLN